MKGWLGSDAAGEHEGTTLNKPLIENLTMIEARQWSCDESEKAFLSVNLASFLVCVRKFVGLQAGTPHVLGEDS